MTDGLTQKARGFSTVYKAISYQLHESWGIKFLSMYITIKFTLNFRNSDIRSRIMENIEEMYFSPNCAPNPFQARNKVEN